MSTTERPTPETDAASFNVYAEWLGRKKLMESDIVEADFARKSREDAKLARLRPWWMDAAQ